MAVYLFIDVGIEIVCGGAPSRRSFDNSNIDIIVTEMNRVTIYLPSPLISPRILEI
jgi:hypothetical protein